ncbi:MAG: hypothetical protein ACLFQQ_11125 [Desulfococcaceae bacterium]
MDIQTAEKETLMDRAAMRKTLFTQTAPWDLAIIDGGATGLGAAVESASRGYRTLPPDVHAAAEDAAALPGETLGRDETWRKEPVDAIREPARGYRMDR